jgi:hypothetical protein
MSYSEIAQAACLSVYSSCDASSCGYFYYWHTTDTDQAWSCNCDVPYGQYEFIYTNAGYSQVGQDYGGQTTDVSGNNLFVRMKTSNTCDSDSWTLVLANLGEALYWEPQTGYCANGAGGGFECDADMANEEVAIAACESVYDSCSAGQCGYFYYYYDSSSYQCNCDTPVGQYEFIYYNAGYTQVGQDYGGQTTSVEGDSLFVRVKSSNTCNSDSWTLALATLGDDAQEPGLCNNGADGVFSCHSEMSNWQTARLACESVYDSCSTGSCGYFYYWYDSTTYSCNCDVPVGQYEFIYDNTGYSQVGQDYGGQSTVVSGNILLVRMKYS